VVGLGNPGPEYASHRHNIGFLVADVLAERFRAGPWKSKFGSDHAKGEHGGRAVLLAKPMEFMNCSGPPVQRLAQFYQVETNDVLVIHDDIALEMGRVKVKLGGGHGGHNGLRSIAEHLGPGHLRVRCGVGHPGSKERVVGHVLSAFSKAEQKELPDLIARAVDAVETVLDQGVERAMNKFNGATV
jgi:PTH1 family peptidyl-tRNA hydrolase